jgi:broad specificity phosphatase PhoE
MRKIHIARHGQNEDNANGILNGHRDTPLTGLGMRQAQELGCGIRKAGLTFDAVYTSPLVRASKTAEIVCEVLDIPPPNVIASLIERNFGVMTGQLAKDIKKLCAPDIIETDTVTYFLSPEGAETFPDLLERAHMMLSGIVQTTPPDSSILLVTHGDFGKMLYASWYGIPWPSVLTSFHFGNGELILLEQGGDLSVPHVIKIDQFNH